VRSSHGKKNNSWLKGKFLATFIFYLSNSGIMMMMYEYE